MENKKKVIGIVPFFSDFGKTDNRYDDKYFFTDTYGVRIQAAGMVPVGIVPVEKRIPEGVLELCDAFVLQGGSNVSIHHVEVIDHAVKTGKKLLGICLGCQAVQSYFKAREEAKKRGWSSSVPDAYLRLREEHFPFLREVAGHYPSQILPRGDKAAVKHPVHLSEGSLLSKIFGKTEISGATFHYYCIASPAEGLIVTGRADDGTIEAVEYGDKIIGTQFHPDADDKLPEIFEWLGQSV